MIIFEILSVMRGETFDVLMTSSLLKSDRERDGERVMDSRVPASRRLFHFLWETLKMNRKGDFSSFLQQGLSGASKKRKEPAFKIRQPPKAQPVKVAVPPPTAPTPEPQQPEIEDETIEPVIPMPVEKEIQQIEEISIAAPAPLISPLVEEFSPVAPPPTSPKAPPPPPSRPAQDSSARSFAREFAAVFPSESYTIEREIGAGTFSSVFEAVCHKVPEGNSMRKVALKRLKSLNKDEHIVKEIEYLRLLNGRHHCVELLDFLHCDERPEDSPGGSLSILVTPYFPHQHFRDYYAKLSFEGIQCYMRELFKSLEHLHSHRIIHRDLKPANFLCSYAKPGESTRPEEATEETMSFCLCDFGLSTMQGSSTAEMIAAQEKKNRSSAHSRRTGAPEAQEAPFQHVNRDGTKGYRAPEVLQRSSFQTSAVDIWSAGVIFLSFLSGVYPVFGSSNSSDLDVLKQYIELLGLPSVEAQRFIQRTVKWEDGEFFEEAIKKARKERDEGNQTGTANSKRIHAPLRDRPYIQSQLAYESLRGPGCPVRDRVLSWCVSTSRCVFPPEAYDLLLKCLDWNPKTRLSAQEALKHPFLTINYNENLDKLSYWKSFSSHQQNLMELLYLESKCEQWEIHSRNSYHHHRNPLEDGNHSIPQGKRKGEILYQEEIKGKKEKIQHGHEELRKEKKIPKEEEKIQGGKERKERFEEFPIGKSEEISTAIPLVAEE